MGHVLRIQMLGQAKRIQWTYLMEAGRVGEGNVEVGFLHEDLARRTIHQACVDNNQKRLFT